MEATGRGEGGVGGVSSVARGSVAASIVCDQAAAVGEDDSLGPVPSTDLRQDPFDVRLRGGFSDHQQIGDLIVGQTVCDQREDLLFAAGQQREGLGLGRGYGGAATLT